MKEKFNGNREAIFTLEKKGYVFVEDLATLEYWPVGGDKINGRGVLRVWHGIRFDVRCSFDPSAWIELKIGCLSPFDVRKMMFKKMVFDLSSVLR